MCELPTDPRALADLVRGSLRFPDRPAQLVSLQCMASDTSEHDGVFCMTLVRDHDDPSEMCVGFFRHDDSKPSFYWPLMRITRFSLVDMHERSDLWIVGTEVETLALFRAVRSLFHHTDDVFKLRFDLRAVMLGRLGGFPAEIIEIKDMVLFGEACGLLWVEGDAIGHVGNGCVVTCPLDVASDPEKMAAVMDPANYKARVDWSPKGVQILYVCSFDPSHAKPTSINVMKRMKRSSTLPLFMANAFTMTQRLKKDAAVIKNTRFIKDAQRYVTSVRTSSLTEENVLDLVAIRDALKVCLSKGSLDQEDMERATILLESVMRAVPPDRAEAKRTAKMAAEQKKRGGKASVYCGVDSHSSDTSDDSDGDEEGGGGGRLGSEGEGEGEGVGGDAW